MWAAVSLQKAGRKWEALRWAYRSEEGVMIHEGPRNGGGVRMGNLVWDLGVGLGLEEDWVEGGDGGD